MFFQDFCSQIFSESGIWKKKQTPNQKNPNKKTKPPSFSLTPTLSKYIPPSPQNRLLTELDVSRGLLHRTGDNSIEQSTPSGWLPHGLCREGDKHADTFPFSSKNSFLLRDEELRFSWDWSANSSVLKYSPRNVGEKLFPIRMQEKNPFHYRDIYN